ncbi:IclR family transcriptional regulator [Acinetobacter pragensis]|uniref:IclR-ED domain-containing protein n=1 Tax=Acinetobacter pragensis TaxID=1806892 RepID=A0A151Y3Y9_9GAMM|nr:IclR family transcriptional regulator C-terminal domain-containing protein [Acinetobacter pragensis]KYQ72740.1 hypothetical protein AZH43_07740 [Acinetobacter pragensis]
MSKLHNFATLLSLFKQHTYIDVEMVKTELQLSTASAYRYLADFEAIGLLEKKTPSNYILGPLVIELDRNIRANDPLIQSAHNLMKGLADVYQNAVIVLSRLYGDDKVLCVHQVQGVKCDLNISYERGKSMAIFKGATSKSILAWLEPERIKEIFLQNKSEILNLKHSQNYSAFEKSLLEIRKNKVCITYSELDEQVYGIASPIFFKNKSIGSLSIVIPDQNMEQLNLKKIGDKVYRSSLQIEAKMEVAEM